MFEEGDRVELVYTNDQYTNLRPGDQGTFKRYFDNLGEQELWIQWDNGSNLSMIPAAGDRVKLVS